MDFFLISGRINRLRDSHGIAIHLVIYVETASEGFVSVIQSFTASSKSAKLFKRLMKVDELLISNVVEICKFLVDLKAFHTNRVFVKMLKSAMCCENKAF
ncbi:CLUMA_CG007152, isoform A [Clunio marinus]|uniref:CLUMA_CG007152, isoform A n=1 Tax=Clunio marinus TaxID=568069 RepID=A0A1J1I425_9DIPT|nr:CLUMA_CG007152, isoform A [Clunio marinus]